MSSQQQTFRIHALELGPMENFVYLIEDIATACAAVVDPAWEVDKILGLAAEKGLSITDILLTHSHYDHVNGIDGVLEHSDAKVHLLKPEAEFWGEQLAKPCWHHGGDQINLGKTEISLLHTPGHTPGSACYHVGEQLITGDTLFVFGCGRCDMTGGDPEQMHNTLRRLKRDLPKDTVIRPGHNYAQAPSSTMAEECEGNPFLHFSDSADFVEFRMHRHGKVRSSPYGPVDAQTARRMLG